MAIGFESFLNSFRRNITYKLNVYENLVPEHLSFSKRSNTALQELYTSVIEVRIIEDFIADFISKIPAGVFDAKDNQVYRSPLNQLIEQSNQQQSFQELLKEYLVYYGLTGNAYMFFHNDYLYNLPTNEIEILTKMPTDVPEYLNYVEAYRHTFEGIERLLPEKNILHLKTAQLMAERGAWVYGSSPYSAAEPNIQALIANNSSRVGTIKDRGAVGFITNDSEYPDKDATETARDAIREYGIKEGDDKFLVTTQKLRFQQMSLGIDELKLLDNLQLDFARLCQLRGIDPTVFAAADSKYANQQSAYHSTVKRALLPMAIHFYDKLNLWIKTQTNTALRILPMVKELPDYSDLGVEQSTRLVAEVNAGILSRSQALEQLYPDLEWEEDTPVSVQVVQANRGEGSSASTDNSSDDKIFNISAFKTPVNGN